MKKQDKIELEKLRIENAKLKENSDIGIQIFADIQDLCFAAINGGMDERPALRCIVTTSITAMDWLNYE